MDIKNAEVPKTTFWAYDVFGYLLPGLVLLFATAMGSSVARNLVQSRWQAGTVVDGLLALVMAYIAGHGTAALSSRFLEAFILRHTWGYPTTVMFRRPAEIVAIPLQAEPSQSKSAAPAGRFASTRRRLSWLKGGLAEGAIIWLNPGYRRGYSADFQRWFDDAFRQTFRMAGTQVDDHDRFWMCWEFISLFHPAGYRRATHFLELYGFSRNVSMAFLLASSFPVWLPGWSPPISAHSWSMAALVIGVVFFANYLKLIRRMNDEVYRAFVVAATFRGTAPVNGQ